MCWFCLDIIALKACQAFCSHVELSFWFEFLLHLFFFVGKFTWASYVLALLGYYCRLFLMIFKNDVPPHVIVQDEAH